jgi:hypothetical protein
MSVNSRLACVSRGLLEMNLRSSTGYMMLSGREALQCLTAVVRGSQESSGKALANKYPLILLLRKFNAGYPVVLHCVAELLRPN